MDEKRLEQELKEHFKAEVKEVEPSNEWWNNALSRVGKERRSLHTEKPVFWRLRPSLIAIPLSIFLLVVLVGSFIPIDSVSFTNEYRRMQFLYTPDSTKIIPIFQVLHRSGGNVNVYIDNYELFARI